MKPNILTEMKSNVIHNVGTFGFYFPFVFLLFIFTFIFPDNNTTQTTTTTTSAYQQVNQANTESNMSMNKASVGIKIACFTMIAISSSVLVMSDRLDAKSKVWMSLPGLLFVIVNGMVVFMLVEKFNDIINNYVGYGYTSVMQWITLTHVIFAMCLWYNTLIINLLSLQALVGLILLGMNVFLHKWLYVFRTGG